MIPSPLAALVRTCVRFTRRRVVAAPSAPPKLTMQQAAAILAPRPRIVRRAVALGCPAAALPTAAVPPVVPVLPLAAPPSAPLPFGIGTGPLLPPVLPEHAAMPLPVQIADVAAAVPEPTALGMLLVAVFLLAVARVS